MGLLKGKHLIKEIKEVRCSIVETGLDMDRVNFLTDILEFNGYTVRFDEENKKEEEDPTTYIIGVTSMIFNAVIAVYQRILFTKEGKRITPDYWNQKTTDIEPNYWDSSKKE